MDILVWVLVIGILASLSIAVSVGRHVGRTGSSHTSNTKSPDVVSGDSTSNSGSSSDGGGGSGGE